MIDAAYGDWLARGQAHQRSGLPIDAMLCFRQALRLNRHAVVAQHHLGEVLGSLRQRAEAIEAWRAALAMQPQHLPSRLALATELFRSGAHAEALVQYRQALAIEPHNAEARMGAALTALAKGDEDRDHAGATAGALIMEDGVAVPWDDVAQVVAALPASPARSAVLA
ncbi:MAG TPA: tetratricopeptide repeat protein, partial [Casimicrobiaceae bacterium]